MKKIVIIGASGHAKEVAAIARQCGYSVVGFLDDDEKKQGQIFCDSLCVGKIKDAAAFKDHAFIIAIGNPRIRQTIYERLLRIGNFNFATLIHPHVIQFGNVKVGEGSVVFPGAFLSDSVSIGKHVIINVHASVSHDCIVEDFVTINPKATICGNCCVASHVEIGASATIIQNINIDTSTFVGAGAVVTQHLSSHTLYVGVPAKAIKNLLVAKVE